MTPMRVKLERGSLVTILVGVGLIVSAAYGYVHMGRFLDTAVQTSGAVIEIVREGTNQKGRMHPVVRFVTADGQQIVGRSEEHHNVRPGDRLELIYDPADPQQFEITTLSRARNRRLAFTIISAVFGGCVCLMGLGVFRRRE